MGSQLAPLRLLGVAGARRSGQITAIRHPEWDQAEQMAFAAATDIQLYAS